MSMLTSAATERLPERWRRCPECWEWLPEHAYLTAWSQGYDEPWSGGYLIRKPCCSKVWKPSTDFELWNR